MLIVWFIQFLWLAYSDQARTDRYLGYLCSRCLWLTSLMHSPQKWRSPSRLSCENVPILSHSSAWRTYFPFIQFLFQTFFNSSAVLVEELADYAQRAHTRYEELLVYVGDGTQRQARMPEQSSRLLGLFASFIIELDQVVFWLVKFTRSSLPFLFRVRQLVHSIVHFNGRPSAMISRYFSSKFDLSKVQIEIGMCSEIKTLNRLPCK